MGQTPIEFKFWDKTNKIMRNCEEIDAIMLGESYHENMIPLQFTGHTLDDGKKLFVGDIVNYATGRPLVGVLAVIEFGYYETYTELTQSYKNGEYEGAEGDIEKHYGFYIRDINDIKYPIGSLWLNYVANIYTHPCLFSIKEKECDCKNIGSPVCITCGYGTGI